MEPIGSVPVFLLFLADYLIYSSIIMATVKVKYREPIVPGATGNIYYQLIINRVVRQIPADYRLYSDEWDESRSRIRCGMRPERADRLKAFEKAVRYDIERLKRIIRECSGRGIVLSADSVADEYRRVSDGGDIFSFMEEMIWRMDCCNKNRTSETYLSALYSFRKFRAFIPLHFDALTPEIVEGYQAWLLERNISLNTVSFYMRILRAAYNKACDAGLTIDQRPFRRVYTGVAKTVKRAISFNDLKKIAVLDLSSDPLLSWARDVFMFLFITRGMSMIDAAFLKKSDLHNGFLSYRRHKTGQLLTIRWEKPMQDIVNRIGDPVSPFLLNIINYSHRNKRRNYLYEISLINRQLKIIASRVGLTVPLTTYVARHTWASVARSRNIPLSIISQGMGHESESTTRIYLASLDSSFIDRANAQIIYDLL